MNGVTHARPRRGTYETPEEIFRPLNEIFHFNLDVAASIKNCKCGAYPGHLFGAEQNGLKQKWQSWNTAWNDDYLNHPEMPENQPTHYDIPGRVWCNPPYNWRQGDPYPKSCIADWLRKGEQEIKAGNCELAVFLLLFSGAKWFWDVCRAGHRVYLHEGRINFINPDTGQPDKQPAGDSILVVMQGERLDFYDLMDEDNKLLAAGWHRMEVTP